MREDVTRGFCSVTSFQSRQTSGWKSRVSTGPPDSMTYLSEKLPLPEDVPKTKFTAIEIPPSTATEKFVPLAGSITGTLEDSDDKDAYKIALTEGYAYRLELKGLEGEDELIDSHLVLRDEDGKYLDQRMALTGRVRRWISDLAQVASISPRLPPMATNRSENMFFP